MSPMHPCSVIKGLARSLGPSADEVGKAEVQTVCTSSAKGAGKQAGLIRALQSGRSKEQDAQRHQ